MEFTDDGTIEKLELHEKDIQKRFCLDMILRQKIFSQQLKHQITLGTNVVVVGIP